MEHNQGCRDRLRGALIESGYEPVDPWEREKIVYSAAGKEWWMNVSPASFIRRDLEDTDGCGMPVAYLPGLSAGTCMELFYTKERGRKNFGISFIFSIYVIFGGDVENGRSGREGG